MQSLKQNKKRSNKSNSCPKNVKGALSDLRQFLANDCPFKMMKMLFISP